MGRSCSYFQMKNPVFCTRFWIYFVAALKSMEKWKEKSSNAACAVLYKVYRQINVSVAHCACIWRSSRLELTRKSAPQLETPATFLQQLCSSAADLPGRYCSKSSFLLFFLHSWNTYYCPISTILKAVSSEQAASSRP